MLQGFVENPSVAGEFHRRSPCGSAATVAYLFAPPRPIPLPTQTGPTTSFPARPADVAGEGPSFPREGTGLVEPSVGDGVVPVLREIMIIMIRAVDQVKTTG
jgi:hypothetical protein